jgi:ABC-type antimicrobial peptide transport system permease subunit
MSSGRVPWLMSVAVATGVAFSVLLMSLAVGVSSSVRQRLSTPALAARHIVNASLIDEILRLLAGVVTAAMLAQTALVVFVLGVALTQTRREEIALRRQSGVFRGTLMRDLLFAMFVPCLVGGLIGEFLGAGATLAIRNATVLPAQFTTLSVLAAFPTTITLALAATAIPAWRAANASPALLRRT